MVDPERLSAVLDRIVQRLGVLDHLRHVPALRRYVAVMAELAEGD